MQSLLDFLAKIGSILSTVITYLASLTEDLIEMLLVLGVATVQLPQILAFLPQQIVAVLAIFLTAAILYKVLGREG